MDLGKAIRVALAQRDMSQTDLAERMGTKGPNISLMISRGSSTTDTIKKMAEAFDMKVSDFLKLGED